jgi:diguanylate cyclase (GGDEF)-like protein/PAS domain S-box-containing protein
VYPYNQSPPMPPLEQPMAEGEARFRALLALSSDWYWEQDAEFRFTMFAGQRNDGLPSGASALIGLRRWDTPGQPIGITWDEHIARLQAHKPFRDLVLHRTGVLSERPIIIRVHGDPMFDARGEFVGYRGIATDITKEKQAELAISEAETRYRSLVNIAPDGILVLDDGKIEFVNDTFVRMMHAQSAAHFLGRDVTEFIHPSYRASVVDRLGLLQHGEAPSDTFLERKLLRADGSVLLAELRGTVFRSGERALIQSVVRDVSRYRQIEDELRFSEQRFRDVAEAAGEYVWEIDTGLRYTYLSDRVSGVLGYTKQELLGKRPFDLMPADEPKAVRECFNSSSAEHGFSNLTHRAITKHGEIIWQQISCVGFRDANGALAGFRGTALNVTERRLAEAQVRRLATHDALTGLPNRTLLLDRLQQALAKSERDGTHVALMFIDLDKFKRINDLLGHSAGDELLRQAARRLSDVLRGEDTLCRIGGDEFVAMVDGFETREQLESIGARILTAIKREFHLTSGRFSVGASLGIALYPEDAREPEELLRRADAAMYQAKSKGGGQIALYSAYAGQGTDERFRFEIELRRAITKNEFRAHLQPLFDAASGALTSAEALIRWQHPERGLLPPGHFIPAAESANLISTLGDWMINHVVGQMHQWREQGRAPLPVSVNVSVQQLATGMDFVDYLDDVLTRYSVPAHWLVLEVTETLLVQSMDAVAGALNAARKLGVRVAMDDFGTGYSSLHLLRQLPIDIIKIDRAFVRDLCAGGKDLAVLAAVVQLARALELKIVAEGVEQAEQLALLRELGFDDVQGYLFAKPMPTEAFSTRYLPVGAAQTM